MASNISDIRSKVVSRIKDGAGRLSTDETTGDVDRCILAALEQYQRDRPRTTAIEVDGDGGFDYPVTALEGYVDGFSSIARIVYPYDEAARDLEELDADDYRLERLASGLVLRFSAATPAADESFLAEFTVPHALSPSTSTVPATDDEALADLAASFCCEELAAVYAQSVDASISADSVDRRSQSAEYRALAKAYASRYADKLGKGETKPAAAGVHVEIDRSFSNEGRTDLFFHGRRRF